MSYLKEPHFSLLFNGEYVIRHASYGLCVARFNTLKEQSGYKGYSNMFRCLDERKGTYMSIQKRQEATA